MIKLSKLRELDDEFTGVHETFTKRLKKYYPNLPILTKGYLNTYVRVK